MATRKILPTATSLALALAVLQGCGGGGGGGGDDGDNGVIGASLFFEDATLVRASSVAGQCTAVQQKRFIRSHLHEVYLWPDAVQRRDALINEDVRGYFDGILAPSNVDRFSFSSSRSDADNRESGADVGVGIFWVRDMSSGTGVPRIGRVDPGSPADLAGLKRGDTLVGRIDTNLDQGGNGPFHYRFTFRRNGIDTPVSLTPTLVQETPVGDLQMIERDGRRIAYLPFESHYGLAQDDLIDAITQAHRANAQELVLDLRYNLGGFMYIAGSLASMVAPRSAIDGREVLVRWQPNAKRTLNSVVRLAPTVQFSASDTTRYPRNTQLPHLQLNRIYVLTSENTCSASESLINGLLGLNMPVHLIGDTTCGKPYGMLRRNNCDTAFFPIEFRGINAKGEANFSSGFEPTCRVADDLSRERGDEQESLLNAALTHISTGSCPNNTQAYAASAAWTQMTPAPQGTTPAEMPRQRPGMALIHNPR